MKQFLFGVCFGVWMPIFGYPPHSAAQFSESPEEVAVTDLILRRWDVSRQEARDFPDRIVPRLISLESIRLGQIAKLQRLLPEDWGKPEYLTPLGRLTQRALALLGELDPETLLSAPPSAGVRRVRLEPAGPSGFLSVLSRPWSADCLFDGDCSPAGGGMLVAARPNLSRPQVPFAEMVSGFVSRAVETFRRTPDRFPESLRKYTEKERRENAREFQNLTARISDPDNPPSPEEQAAIGKRVFGILLGGHGSLYDDLRENGTLGKLSEFAREARAYDPKIGDREIFQAGRNVWTANTLQVFLGTAVRLTDSIFGYSMLYPYTDNFLDDDDVPRGQKMDFSGRFRRRLAGEAAETKGPLEGKIWDMVARIEREWSRKDSPEVYDSLLAIHDAQTQSMQQRIPDGQPLPDPERILGISAGKGGASVLADGVLAKGKLGEEDAYAVFLLGFALQLLDDLQDVSRDISERHYTLFSLAARAGERLDAIANKVLHLIEAALRLLGGNAEDGLRSLRDAMLNFCGVLLIEAVAKTPDLFSAGYVKQCQRVSAIGLKHLKKMEIEKKIFKSAVPNSSDFTPR